MAQPTPGSFLSVLQDGDTQLFFCFWTSFLNGYIKTYIYSHVADIKLPAESKDLELSKYLLRGGSMRNIMPQFAPILGRNCLHVGLNRAHLSSLGVSRYHQSVSRKLSTASQLAALSASVSMFLLGPILGFLPE